jgi:hypothetical protein
VSTDVVYEIKLKPQKSEYRFSDEEWNDMVGCDPPCSDVVPERAGHGEGVGVDGTQDGFEERAVGVLRTLLLRRDTLPPGDRGQPVDRPQGSREMAVIKGQPGRILDDLSRTHWLLYRLRNRSGAVRIRRSTDVGRSDRTAGRYRHPKKLAYRIKSRRRCRRKPTRARAIAKDSKATAERSSGQSGRDRRGSSARSRLCGRTSKRLMYSRSSWGERTARATRSRRQSGAWTPTVRSVAPITTRPRKRRCLPRSNRCMKPGTSGSTTSPAPTVVTNSL